MTEPYGPGSDDPGTRRGIGPPAAHESPRTPPPTGHDRVRRGGRLGAASLWCATAPLFGFILQSFLLNVLIDVPTDVLSMVMWVSMVIMVMALVLPVPAVVLGILALRQSGRHRRAGFIPADRTPAVIGLVLGSLELVFFIPSAVVWFMISLAGA
jgi:hypothetical protein